MRSTGDSVGRSASQHKGAFAGWFMIAVVTAATFYVADWQAVANFVNGLVLYPAGDIHGRAPVILDEGAWASG